MPRRREKFVEITKTVTVTEIVNGAPDKHPSSCEVKVTNVSPAGPHPVNVSIRHLHEKWHSSEQLDDTGDDLGKGTVIRIHEKHTPVRYNRKRSSGRSQYEEVVKNKVETSERTRPSPSSDTNLFNRSTDNIIDLEFRHPILVETSGRPETNGTRRRFADLRKKVSTTTRTSTTETEKVTTTRRSSSAHSTSSRRSYGKPEVRTLYYRKFIDEDTKREDEDSDSGSVIIRTNSVRSQSADPLHPVAPPRKRLGREESLHYYRDDEEVQLEKEQRVNEPMNTSVSMNDSFDHQNLTAGITCVSMNNTFTDTSFESRFSTIPRARSSPPGNNRVNHIQVNVIGPNNSEDRHAVVGSVGDDVTMDIYIEDRRRASVEAPPKPPRRSKWEDHHKIGQPLATSTPMTTIERMEKSGESSRKSTRSSRPPDINIIECESTRSPARTPATPIVVVNQTPSSRRSSQDLLGESGQRRRKSTVTDIDWYAAFNMKDPSSPTKPLRSPFGPQERRSSRDVRRRASDSSMIGVPPADIDLNQIFSCTAPKVEKDEKCQCNACRLIRMSEAERQSRIVRDSKTRQSRSYSRIVETRSSTLPSRHRTSPVNIRLEDVFNPNAAKPPTPPNRRRPPTQSSAFDEPHHVISTIDRSQVTSVTTNSRDGSQLHAHDQLLPTEDVDWVGQMMREANDWETKSRKTSVTRRISVDELTSPDKKTSRTAVPLPPSDVSIDDIFTALTQKKEDVAEKKTFIVTRKQRAKDVEEIEFLPVAPPRSRKSESSDTFVTEQVLNVEVVRPSVTSNASINIDDVFTQGSSKRADNDNEDEKIRKRIAEFERSAKEKEDQRTVIVDVQTTRKIHEESDISMDDVFNSDQKSVEVVVPIGEKLVTSEVKTESEHPVKHEDTNVGDVFGQESATRSGTGEEEHQNAQVMNDVYNKEMGSERVTSEAKFDLKDSSSNTTGQTEASINLDDVFTQGSSKPSENDEEDEKIRRRIAEFERSKKEKEDQRTTVVEVQTTRRILDESDISMDDVFSPDQKSVEVVIPIGEESVSSEVKTELERPIKNLVGKPGNIDFGDVVTSEEKFDLEDSTATPPRNLETTSNLDDVFNQGSSKPSETDEEDEKIRRRIAEFERSRKEKEDQRTTVVEVQTTRRILDESDISMDDVFNPYQKSVEVEKQTVTSQANTMLEHPVTNLVGQPEDIDSDDVFGQRSSKPSTSPDPDHKPVEVELAIGETSVSSEVNTESEHPVTNLGDVVTSEAKFELEDSSAIPTERLEASINLDDVFTQGSSTISQNDEEDEKIRRRIAEFERSKKEKEDQRTVVVETRTTRRILDESDISLDDVFNHEAPNDSSTEPFMSTQNVEEPERSNHESITRPSEESYDLSVQSDDLTVQGQFVTSREEENGDEDRPTIIDESAVSTEIKQPEPECAVRIDLDDVFPRGSLKPENDQEDEKIRRRVAEFERTKKEKEDQRTVVVKVRTSRNILEESDISMDDVFNPDQKSVEVVLPIEGEFVPSDAKTESEHLDFFRQGSSRPSTGESRTENENVAEDQRVAEETLDDVSNKDIKIMIPSEDPTVISDAKFPLEESTAIPTGHPEPAINLDDVFTQGSSKPSETDEEDGKIRRRIAEFERSRKEKEDQRTTVVEDVHTTRKILDESDISMDDVFNPEQKSVESVLAIGETSVISEVHTELEHPDSFRQGSSNSSMDYRESQTKSETVMEDQRIGVSKKDVKIVEQLEEPTVTSDAKFDLKESSTSTIGRLESDVNLDDVFTQGSSKPSENDEEDEKIRRRIAEFEKSKKEKEDQRTVVVEVRTTRTILDESDISMDDVFNPDQKSVEVAIPIGEESKEETSEARTKLEHPVTNLVGQPEDIDSDDVFGQRSSKPSTGEDQIIDGTLLDDVSNKDVKVMVPLEQPTVTSDTKFELEESSAIPAGRLEPGINLDDVFTQGSSKQSVNDEEDEKIRRRIAEFERSKKEKEDQRTTVVEVRTTRRILDESDISMDDVFNPDQKSVEVVIPIGEESVTSEVRTELEHPITNLVGQPGNTSSGAKFDLEDSTATPPRSLKTTINLDNVFNQGSSKPSETDGEDEKIRRRIAEFERSRKEKEDQRTTVVEDVHTTRRILDESDISMDDVFNPDQKSVEVVLPIFQPTVTSEKKTNLEHPVTNLVGQPGDIDFNQKPSTSDQERRTENEKVEEDQRKEDQKKVGKNLDDVFETSTVTSEEKCELEDSSAIPAGRLEQGINLEDVFTQGSSTRSQNDGEEDEKIRRRIAEFERSKKEKEDQRTVVVDVQTSRKFLEESDISMDDVFNPDQKSVEVVIPIEEENVTSEAQMLLEHPVDNLVDQKQIEVVVPLVHSEKGTPSNIDLEDVFTPGSSTRSQNDEEDEKIRRRIAEFERSKKEKEDQRTTVVEDVHTSRRILDDSDISMDDIFNVTSSSETVKTTTTTETSYRRVFNLDDLFGPQTATPPETESEEPEKTSFNKNLLSAGKWNESMMSTTSTISLDDSFRSTNQPKMRKKLALPVDNWIDSLVAQTTAEATQEFRSPTRISQEIKYEWVADLVSEKEEHQTEEEHLQKQDSTWVSSVVYRPTLETSAYTLRASQVLEDLDEKMDCLIGEKKDKECECSACRITQNELEMIRKRKIESEKMTREENDNEIKEEFTEPKRSVMDPSDISIDDVFNPSVPLHIQTGHPSTSSPPLLPTRTYYLSPKVSETVTTTHQWKDADISMDDVFSPVSSTHENRRFSNFYEDRSGWDTMGSEDSGMMSGGERRRRQLTDSVIDDAFKAIFDTTTIRNETKETQYDDYYITSLQEEADNEDSEVDGSNLDVTQFVDDILGRSMDEAAFLSSTKSLRDHTDTSIDRKKTSDKVHPYYRTRTDTSIDKRSKPEVITEDHESPDEILKLIFVNPSSTDFSSSSHLQTVSSTTKPNDEELLEIEVKPEYFLIKGSYSLLILKTDPLGQMLQKLQDHHDSLATLDFSVTRKLKKLLVTCIREKAGNLQMTSSSKHDELSSRGQSLIDSVDHASSTFLRMNVDKFEPIKNPNGIVNFCTAENNICTPLLEEHFKHLELFFPNTEHLVRYPPAGGWPAAREVLVKYFKEFMGARVTAEELVLTASTRTGYDVVSYCFFEEDDILLTNGPVYTGTISNVHERARCQVECVPTDLSNPRLELKKYEEELSRQNSLDNTVTGIIIVNPHNPLGVVFPPEDVVALCNWAASKNLRVIIDEVFVNCVFDKINSRFRPFLSYRHRLHQPEKVAWLWSVSKDFGLPGLKFAVIHSANEGLRAAAMKLQLYHPCSPFVQDFAVKLLSDSDFLRGFHTEVVRRMAIHYRYTAENLKQLDIPFVPAQAGIFVFADFSKHITSNDTIGELELFERLGSQGVMLTPGVHQKCHVAGWFRLVFACSRQELEEGFRRLYHLLQSPLEPVGSVEYK